MAAQWLDLTRSLEKRASLAAPITPEENARKEKTINGSLWREEFRGWSGYDTEI